MGVIKFVSVITLTTLLVIALVEGRIPGVYQGGAGETAHATFYGGSDASATMGHSHGKLVDAVKAEDSRLEPQIGSLCYVEPVGCTSKNCRLRCSNNNFTCSTETLCCCH